MLVHFPLLQTPSPDLYCDPLARALSPAGVIIQVLPVIIHDPLFGGGRDTKVGLGFYATLTHQLTFLACLEETQAAARCDSTINAQAEAEG
jgi:hypothetical protein